MINLLLLLVYLLIWLFFQLEPPGTTWNHLEPPGTSWNQLEPPGSSWNLVGLGSSGTDWKFTSNCNPGGKFGGCSLLIWQVPYSENSSQNLWGTVKTSLSPSILFKTSPAQLYSTLGCYYWKIQMLI